VGRGISSLNTYDVGLVQVSLPVRALLQQLINKQQRHPIRHRLYIPGLAFYRE
jgi:hypothetical protein